MKVCRDAVKHKCISFSQGADELQMIRDSLQSLRVHMIPSDPQHHVVDTLEHNIALLLQSNRTSSTQAPVNQSQVELYSFSQSYVMLHTFSQLYVMLHNFSQSYVMLQSN